MAGKTGTGSSALDRDRVWQEFRDTVNMAPGELERWLQTEESRSAGWPERIGGETVGHHSGRRIITVKHKRKDELTDDDYRHMRKVVGYIHRHKAQGGPGRDKAHSRWRYSLMNWGHDPIKH